MWIPYVSTSDYRCCETSSSTKQKWCASTTSRVALDNFNQFIERKPNYTREELIKKVPKECHSKIDVLFKQDANILLDHRDENHEIELLESKQAFFVRNYKPLLEQETDAMKKYIDKYFGKSFIKSSMSAAAAPILLVKKPEGELKFCVNYKALNAITVKNKYLILLINEMLGKLLNSK